jgi:hypothetical protein
MTHPPDSQYLSAFMDAYKAFLDGTRSYSVITNPDSQRLSGPTA